MSKIITDEKLIDELLTRGVENIFPNREELKKVLLSGKRIKLYCGYDPTASSLHIGNAISLNKLGQFQKLGHEVVFLVGDFTGMIGDPTDKTAARKKLSREEVMENCKNYQKQASGYLKFDGENPVTLKYNSEWNDKLTSRDLIELSANFTVQQMLKRSMFMKRLTVVVCEHCKFTWPSPIQFFSEAILNKATLKNNTTTCPKCGKITGINNKDLKILETDSVRENPIYINEFLYPLIQAYDSVTMDVDLEIGGNDQMFNMLCGRDLMKTLKNKEKFVITMKLLADESGKKMGKTEGNGVNLDETAENMFGQIMAWSDGLIAPAFELCTNVSMEEVKIIDPAKNPRDAKIRLAHEITKINHGEEKAKMAEENFINTFSKKETPTDIQEVKIEKSEMKLTEVIVLAKLASSVSDARRKIEQGGVEIDGKKIEDWKIVLDSKNNGAVLKVGKFGFVKIKF
jgi:tyrosyl-tRNA synthetase